MSTAFLALSSNAQGLVCTGLLALLCALSLFFFYLLRSRQIGAFLLQIFQPLRLRRCFFRRSR